MIDDGDYYSLQSILADNHVSEGHHFEKVVLGGRC